MGRRKGARERGGRTGGGGGGGRQGTHAIRTRLFALRPPISRNWRTLLHMADFTQEPCMFTAQCELANRNFAGASVRRNEQRGLYCRRPFPLSSSPIPDGCYAGYRRRDVFYFLFFRKRDLHKAGFPMSRDC